MLEQTLSQQTTLSPQLQHQLDIRLKEYLRLGVAITQHEVRKEVLKAEIDALFTEAGEGAALLDGASVNGVRVKLICGTSNRLNKKRLVELGCAPEWIEEATEAKPSTPYIRISEDRTNDGE